MSAKPALVEPAEANHRPTVVPVQPGRRIGGIAGAEPGNDRDRELQALGGVDRHDAQRVLTLVGAQLDTIDVVDATVDPRQVLGERATGGIAPGAGLVDHVAHTPPRLPGHLRAFRQGRGDPAPAVVQLGDQLRRRALVLAPAELIDHAQRVADVAGLSA